MFQYSGTVISSFAVIHSRCSCQTWSYGMANIYRLSNGKKIWSLSFFVSNVNNVSMWCPCVVYVHVCRALLACLPTLCFYSLWYANSVVKLWRLCGVVFCVVTFSYPFEARIQWAMNNFLYNITVTFINAFVVVSMSELWSCRNEERR